MEEESVTGTAEAGIAAQHDAAATAALFARAEDAGTAVLTLTESLEREELLRSRLTRHEVRRHLLIMAGAFDEVSAQSRLASQEIDWEGWRTTASRLQQAGPAMDDALWFAVGALVPATLIWLRQHRASGAPPAA